MNFGTHFITKRFTKVSKDIARFGFVKSQSRSVDQIGVTKIPGLRSRRLAIPREEYFSFNEIEDDSRIQISGFHMAKGAMNWMRGLQRNNLLSSWEKFEEEMGERFGSFVFEDKSQEFSHIQQTSTVEAYLERFEELLSDVTGQSKASLVSFFVGDLKPYLRSEINIARPDSLHQAFSLAKIYEAQRGRNKFHTSNVITESLIKTPTTGPKGLSMV